MMERRAYVVGLIASAGMLTLAGAQQPQNPETASEPRISIAVQRGRLTASIEDSPLHSVLEELGGRTQILFVAGNGLEEDHVSAELKDVPVEEGLRDLLKNHDAFFYYGAAGENGKPVLRAVWVYPRGAGATVRPVPPVAWASTKDLEASLADSDPAIRERAYEALMSRPDRESSELLLLALRGATETDPEMRQRLLSSALSNGIDVPHEILADLVRTDGSEEIRMMALDALRGDPSSTDAAVAALTDPSEAVRERAKELLAEIDTIRRRR
jgi:hypothetical protein